MNIKPFFFFIFFLKFIDVVSQSKIDFTFNSFLEKSSFDWSIAGNISGSNPNVLSKLQFQDVVVVGGSIEVSYELLDHVQVDASFQAGTVISGNGTDTDYEEDNCQGIIFNEKFQSDDGAAKTFKAGVKYFLLNDRKMALGVGLHYYRSSRGYTLSSSGLQDLRSLYNLDLKGFQLSLNPVYNINPRLRLKADISYTKLTYRAKANWNLIEIFQHPISFIHLSEGFMGECQLGATYSLNKQISINSGGKWGTTRIGEGLDKTFLKNGSEIKTLFNGGRLEIFSIHMGILFGF